ncbi:MAG: hypothetical protein PVSMB11_03370 [Desulfuromonadaceae bacterium]
MKRLLAAILLMVLMTNCAGAQSARQVSGHIHLDKYDPERWCNEHNGLMEYVLEDRTRVDCLTDDFAIEFDFAPKWAESVGQALYYALKTGKQPGVVLIMEKEGDARHLKRLNALAVRYNIKVWTTP